MPHRARTTGPVLLLFFVALVHQGQADVTGWHAEPYPGVFGLEATFGSGLTFNVSFVGGNDLVVTWEALAHTATVLRLCTSDGSCAPPHYLPPPPTNGSHDAALLNAIPPGSAPANLTVELVDAATNASLLGATKSFSVGTFLGEQLYHLALSSSGGGAKYNMALNGVAIPHWCRWTAQLPDRTVVVEALLSLTWPQLNTWQCVVPDSFDNQLPAGTNFTMSILVLGGALPPPTSPVVVPTGAVVHKLLLPALLCTGQYVKVEGFFFPSRRYNCAFQPFSGSSLATLPETPNLILCQLPNTSDTARVLSVEVWEWYDAVRFVGMFVGDPGKPRFTFDGTCPPTPDNGGGGGDGVPYWVWIIVGLACSVALLVVLTLAVLHGRRRRRAYEQL